MGETPHGYIMRQRIRRAQILMLESRDLLSQIACACGLTDQAHLTRLFRRALGTTPDGGAPGKGNCDPGAQHRAMAPADPLALGRFGPVRFSLARIDIAAPVDLLIVGMRAGDGPAEEAGASSLDAALHGTLGRLRAGASSPPPWVRN
jgi:AraC-like DNA-binding protein